MKVVSKIITIKAKDHDKAGLDKYPNAGPNPSISGMRSQYHYGERNHTIIKCGSYIYNVPNEDLKEIFERIGLVYDC